MSLSASRPVVSPSRCRAAFRFGVIPSYWSDSPEQANASAVKFWSTHAYAMEGCDDFMNDNVDGSDTEPGEPHASYGLIHHNTTSLAITVTKVNANP